MNDKQLRELDALARAARDKPWYSFNGVALHDSDGNHWFCHDEKDRDKAAFIDAFSPYVAIKLIAELQEARAFIDHFGRDIDLWHEYIEDSGKNNV